ncbi:exodeoxyribonuclease VII large subunit [Silvibacterium bohemicum]|uniref:Exodeoxyribonuclease 7 large subunit n=1 Tax=Silvibacterium bohemicum TaxID=1577686 RepID=A0A841JQR3_9BACT|nr:exodeoxyribonuclease VII large subunit [Silvibacterium bohemicum]MBB6142765.1 exodeoxyribonuclease VII large subunit [Silvibacterium bohemicum]
MVSQLGFSFEETKTQQRRVWKISELTGQLRLEVERSFSDLWIEGEICDFRPAASGHLYFNLKDESAQLSVVMFRRQAGLLRFRPEDGLHVLLRGKLSVYEQRGSVQIVAEHLEVMGAGSLQLAFEQVKRQLQHEGLFDAERKKPLPAFPRCVGIVTSPSGAVIRDFLNVAGRRHSALQVLLYPALVQGDAAAAEVAAGIAFFNRSQEVDVIVVARGGGSLEDLTPFNSEFLARAIAASDLPVVSAIGHETDFTIADFVADLRAPTPSAAAELITGAQHKIEEQVEQLSLRIHRAARYALIQARERFARLSAPAAFARLQDGLNRRQQRVDELSYRAETLVGRQLQRASQRVQQLSSELIRHDVSHRLKLADERLESLAGRLLHAQVATDARHRARLKSLERNLVALSPLGVLSRGYALVYDENGALLRDAAQAHPGQILKTRLARGSVESRVTQTSQESNGEQNKE